MCPIFSPWCNFYVAMTKILERTSAEKKASLWLAISGASVSGGVVRAACWQMDGRGWSSHSGQSEETTKSYVQTPSPCDLLLPTRPYLLKFPESLKTGPPTRDQAFSTRTCEGKFPIQIITYGIFLCPIAGQFFIIDKWLHVLPPHSTWHIYLSLWQHMMAIMNIISNYKLFQGWFPASSLTILL